MKSVMTILLLAVLVASAAASCSTIAGAAAASKPMGVDGGHKCTFPFTWPSKKMGAKLPVTYHACTEVDSPGKPWCRTTGSIAGDTYWGYCADTPACKVKATTNATVAPTTTMTALDSSASSNSGQSSGSLNSVGSGPTGSFNTGSSVSGSVSAGGSFSGSSASFGSNDASGSWGSQLQIWQWVLLIALCCCCCGGGAASMSGKNKKKSTKKKAPAAAPVPAAAPAAVEDVEPLLATMPPLVPLATTSYVMPSYPSAAQAYPVTYAAPYTTTGQVV